MQSDSPITIILGSSSRWRQKILTEAGVSFEVLSPDIDEKAIRHASPEILTTSLSQAKCNALKDKVSYPAIIITSDQVAVCNGTIREKPVDRNEAREFLKSYAQYPVTSVTAVTTYNTITKQFATGVDIVDVYLKHIPDSIIEEMIVEGAVLTCAGGFAIDLPSFEPYIDRIEGARDSVIGLPLELTFRLVRKVGGESTLPKYLNEK